MAQMPHGFSSRCQWSTGSWEGSQNVFMQPSMRARERGCHPERAFKSEEDRSSHWPWQSTSRKRQGWGPSGRETRLQAVSPCLTMKPWNSWGSHISLSSCDSWRAANALETQENVNQEPLKGRESPEQAAVGRPGQPLCVPKVALWTNGASLVS